MPGGERATFGNLYIRRPFSIRRQRTLVFSGGVQRREDARNLTSLRKSSIPSLYAVKAGFVATLFLAEGDMCVLIRGQQTC